MHKRVFFSLSPLFTASSKLTAIHKGFVCLLLHYLEGDTNTWLGVVLRTMALGDITKGRLQENRTDQKK